MVCCCWCVVVIAGLLVRARQATKRRVAHWPSSTNQVPAVGQGRAAEEAEGVECAERDKERQGIFWRGLSTLLFSLILCRSATAMASAEINEIVQTYTHIQTVAARNKETKQNKQKSPSSLSSRALIYSCNAALYYSAHYGIHLLLVGRAQGRPLGSAPTACRNPRRLEQACHV